MIRKQVRWGVLGTAKIARDSLCPALQCSERGHLGGIASRNIAKAEAFAAPYPRAKAYGSYEALLADSDIDAVYIPLPNSDHVEWTLKCLKAGKHVLCEKPIAMKADQIDQLIAARDRTGLLAAEAFMVMHHPQWLRVREWIAEGRIGTLKHVQGVFTYNNPNTADIRNQASLGGGGIPDIGVYPSVTARFVTGEEPVTVCSKIEWENDVDIAARVWADFPSFSMDFYVSMRMALRQEMVFHGTSGFLTVYAPFNPPGYGAARIEVRLANGEKISETFASADQYVNQFDNFHATVLDGAEYPCPLEFSKNNQRMIDMIFAAEI